MVGHAHENTIYFLVNTRDGGGGGGGGETFSYLFMFKFFFFFFFFQHDGLTLGHLQEQLETCVSQHRCVCVCACVYVCACA